MKGVKNEVTMVDEKILNSICENVGTPFYAYNYDNIRKRFMELKNSLPDNANLCYSVKANPSFAICQIISQLTSKVETSSLGEIQCAIKAGFKSENIILSGPGKTKEMLTFAIVEGICISVESVEETYLISDLCRALNKYSKIILRINPNISENKCGIVMCGLPSQFGIDYSEIEESITVIRKSEKVNLVGLSIYLGSQILDAQTIIKNTRNSLNLFMDFQREHNLKVNILDLGGGFGIPYYNDNWLDLKTMKEGLGELFKEYDNELKGRQILFESGRYIMADSGSFFTKILYRKKSRNRNYLICDGGFNNALIAAFFTREIRGNFPINIANKKLDSLSSNQSEYYICGPLCSPRDVLGSKVLLPNIDTGDILEIERVGAYGLTYSTLFFLSHDIPAEIIIKGNRYYIIRNRTQGIDFLNNQLALPDELLINLEDDINDNK